MLGLIRHNRCFIWDPNAFAHTERFKEHFCYYLFKKHELIDLLVTDLSGMSTMIYIHIDLNGIFLFSFELIVLAKPPNQVCEQV